MYSIKDAMLAREHDPKSESYIFHTDLRNVGKWFQKYEIRGKEEYGVNFVRGRVAEITEDQEQNPIVWYEDTNTQEVRSRTVDMVVLATAAIPSKGIGELAKLLGVATDEYGFIKTGLPFPTDTSVAGVFACGFCIAPADIPESVAQASAAASRAAEMVFAPEAKRRA
jgi:heterodisulfide reductase subunit A